jgi:hypothetical protein
VFGSLPLVYPTINNINSATVIQLQQLGVANISITVAEQNQGFAGRLKLFKSNWDKICSDQWILHAIRGYHIEWLRHPYQRGQPHCPRFSREETESLELEIAQMLEKQAISQVDAHSERQGFLSSIFLVPKKDGGHRPIINLKKLNEFIPHTHFKMEGIHMLKDLLRQGDFMAKIDVKDAYFAVPINEKDRKP